MGRFPKAEIAETQVGIGLLAVLTTSLESNQP